MLTEDLLSRLSQLNRARAPCASGDPPAVPCLTVPQRPEADRPHDEVSQLPPGAEVVNAWGRHWVRERDLEAIWPHGAHWLSDEMARLNALRDAPRARAAELEALLQHLPEHVILVDLETCGFAGSPIFLVGLLHQRDQRWTLSQLLARTYAEEKPLLQTLWTMVSAKRVLVTFNGKSFDWPMVHDRSTLHHLGQDPRYPAATSADASTAAPPAGELDRNALRPVLIHCDLLHHARRRWGQQLPDCRLQTLERYLCRRRRDEDIPGREIPAAYHDFVRHGDAWLMRNVLHHNALDLITLLQLAAFAIA